MRKQVSVLGLGNLIYSDEGVGMHAIRALQDRMGNPEPIAESDGGMLGMSLLPLVEECSHLLVLAMPTCGATFRNT